MPTTFRSLFLPMVLLAGVSLVLAGCGRKGDLDVPGAPPVKQTDSTTKTKPKVPERPFFLDPIL